jgi:hypothetical protein
MKHITCKILRHKTNLKRGDIIESYAIPPKVTVTLTTRCTRCGQLLEFKVLDGVIQ